MPPAVASNDINNHMRAAPSSPATSRVLAKWLLAGFVFAELAWVGIWTILAAHTDVARHKIYPALESTYFPDKSGARVFTYLGVFYLIAGAISLFSLAVGVRLPKPTTSLVKTYTFPFSGDYWTVLELTALAVFVSIQVATILTRVLLKFKPTWPDDKVWYEVTKTLGKTAALTLTVLFLPVSKSCFWLDLFNIHFERAIKFHRWLAWFLVIVVILHAASAFTSLILSGQFKACMWPSPSGCEANDYKESLELSRIITYGWASAVIALPMITMSLSWFRRHKFEWFYYTHFLFVPSIIMVHLHFKDMIYYTAPGLAAYTLDKVIWYFSSRRPVKIINLARPVPGFVRMTISVEFGHTFEPGQWVLVNVPSVSFYQWHPMSVASAPGGTSFTIDIKVLGDWTRGLERLSLRFDPSRHAHTCVFLDRFHGSSHSQMQGYLSHPTVLMVAGGIGITPLMSTLRALMKTSSVFSSVRRVVLVWIVKKESVIGLYRSELSRMQALQETPSGCKLDIRIYATLSEKEDSIESVSLPIDSQKKSKTERKSCSNPPFMQHVMGYGHMLLLTVGSGGGFLLGLFVANLIAFDKEWPTEYHILLQLCLATVFSGAMAAIGMSASVFRQAPRYSFHESKLEHESEKKPLLTGSSPSTNSFEVGETSTNKSTVTASCSDLSQDAQNGKDIKVVLGRRPDLGEVINDVKNWCREDGCSSVGVAVCGPNNLTDTVVKTCRGASSDKVAFVVDNETFDW